MKLLFKSGIDRPDWWRRELQSRIPGLELPDYPENTSSFQEEMETWSAASHQGQAHVSELDGNGVLPILFGGGASLFDAAKGRHDPCVLPRAVPMVEAAVLLTLADHWLRQRAVDVL